MSITNNISTQNNLFYNNKSKSTQDKLSELIKLMSNRLTTNEKTDDDKDKEDVIPNGMTQQRYDAIKAAADMAQTAAVGGAPHLFVYPVGEGDCLDGFSGTVFGTNDVYSAHFSYAEHSTPENPCIVAEGFDEDGNVFLEEIYINEIDLANANMLELTALMDYMGLQDKNAHSLLFNTSGHGIRDKVNVYEMAKEQYEYTKQFSPELKETINKYESIINAMERHSESNGFQLVDSSKSNYRAPAMTPHTPSYIKQAYYKLSYNNYL
ncbi:hypothetical protein AN642_03035 [Epulopiscium sp. SCG-B10WGA-EpuloA2]|nr:hypothetical protein AN642_03035 [Epulopiscium sp. SCG-B10WGA-EpuloA2]